MCEHRELQPLSFIFGALVSTHGHLAARKMRSRVADSKSFVERHTAALVIHIVKRQIPCACIERQLNAAASGTSVQVRPKPGF